MEEGYSFVGLGHRHRSRSIQPVFLEGVELRWKHLSSEQVGIRSTIAISLSREEGSAPTKLGSTDFSRLTTAIRHSKIPLTF
jgi:hypothetical protein